MNLCMDVAKNFLGRQISDHYGATIGRIVGISTDAKNAVTSIEVELGNGQFLNCPPSRIIIGEKTVTLLEEWKIEAESLKTEFDLALRRTRALSDLHRQGDIQPEIYEDFRRSQDLNLSDLGSRREALTRKLASVGARLDQQIRELETFLANNKMQLAAGEIDAQAYKIATDCIENGLNRTFSTKRDVEEMLRQATALGASRPEDQLQRTPTAEILLQETVTGKIRSLTSRIPDAQNL